MSIHKILCPRDHTALVCQSYESIVQIDCCPQCSGVWLDKGELEKIEDSSTNDYPQNLKIKDDPGEEGYEMAEQEARPEITCPKCRKSMEKSEYGYCSGVIINTCPHCGGRWLDKGELKSIVVFFEKAKLECSPELAKFWHAVTDIISQISRLPS
jgi:uncharacterized protein